MALPPENTRDRLIRQMVARRAASHRTHQLPNWNKRRLRGRRPITPIPTTRGMRKHPYQI